MAFALIKSQKGYDKEYFIKLQEGYLQDKPWVRKRMEIIWEYISPKKNDIILETGFGSGTLAYDLARVCDRVVAIDNDCTALKSSIDFFSMSSHPPKNINLLLGDLQNIPLKSNYFSKIIFSEVIEHLTDPKSVLLELNRVLDEDGLMVLTTWPSLSNLTWRLMYKLGKGPEEDFNPQTPNSIKQLLSQTGFNILRMDLSNFHVRIPFTGFAIDGWLNENRVAKTCEKQLTKGKLGQFFASSINVLAKKGDV